MIRTLTLAAAGALALAACSQPSEPAPSPDPAPSAGEPTPPPSAGAVLTAQGFGPLRIGMTRAEVEAALGADSNPDVVGGPDPESCDMFHPARAPEGLLVMVQDGVLTSVWLTRDSTAKTDRGFGIGDTAATVKQAYGSALVAEPHKYEDAPAEYLFAWTSADHSSAAARGIKYEVGMNGQVQSVAGGGPSIAYVEGCA